MIIEYCQDPGRLTGTERAMVAAGRDLPGVLVVSALVTVGRRAREIDGIWIGPHGVVCLEAKATTMSGELTVRPNGPWRVGDAPVDFVFGPNPVLQARSGAQPLCSVLDRHNVHVGFVPAVVSILGERLTFRPTHAGDVLCLRFLDLLDLPLHLTRPSLGRAGESSRRATQRPQGVPLVRLGRARPGGTLSSYPRPRRDRHACRPGRQGPNSIELTT